MPEIKDWTSPEGKAELRRLLAVDLKGWATWAAIHDATELAHMLVAMADAVPALLDRLDAIGAEKKREQEEFDAEEAEWKQIKAQGQEAVDEELRRIGVEPEGLIERCSFKVTEGIAARLHWVRDQRDELARWFLEVAPHPREGEDPKRAAFDQDRIDHCRAILTTQDG